MLSPSSGLPGLFPLPYELGLRRLRDDFGLEAVEYELTPASAYRDVDRPWEEPRTFETEPDMEPAEGWSWHNADRVVEGAGWGGSLETLSWLLMADRTVQPAVSYSGNVLFLETSEEMPGAQEVYRILRSMGERGLLKEFPALLMGRAKSWSFDNPLTAPEKAHFRSQQREAVLRALHEYAPDTMAVFDIELGHTDPQVVIPVGGRIRVDGPARRVVVTY
ncbi:LD-carboxypeptidase [Streptomyces sp. 2112.3]|nr:LD-carboxypeptidase [Streptomyces sp. 2112.3]